MPTIDLITPTAPIATPTHGGRAKCLQRLVRLDLPVPSTVALSFEMVKSIAAGHKPDLDAILNQFSPDDILCGRPSSESVDWGGPSAILNIGMNDARYVELSDKLGQEDLPRQPQPEAIGGQGAGNSGCHEQGFTRE